MTVEEMCATLTERYPHDGGWDIYRRSVYGFCVQLRLDSGHYHTLAGDTITEALTEAVKYRFLPEVSRRPKPLSRSCFEIRKAGGNWEVQQDGHFCFRLKSKRAAEEAIDRLIQINRAQMETWERECLPLIAGKTEGVDFRFV